MRKNNKLNKAKKAKSVKKAKTNKKKVNVSVSQKNKKLLKTETGKNATDLKVENASFLAAERKAKTDEIKKEEYTLNDFTFKFKKAPNNNKEFKEIVVSYLYNNKIINYFCFVPNKFNKEKALRFAKKQVKNLINNNKIVDYAKMYYKKIY